MSTPPANVVRLPQRGPTSMAPDLPQGMSPFALPVYRLLVEHGRLATTEIAALLSLAAADALAAVDDLATLRLVRRLGTAYVAVPREQAADEIFLEQAEQLSASLAGLTRRQDRLKTLFQNRYVLDEDLARGIRQVCLGTDDIGELYEMPADARHSLSAIHPGGVFEADLLELSLDSARENLQRGVRLRAVHQFSAMAHPRVVQYLSEVAAAGGEVRLRNNLPTRLLVIDGTAAVCSLPAGDGSVQTFMLSGLRVVGLLAQMFETTWLDATPFEAALEAATSRGRSRSPEPVGTPPVEGSGAAPTRSPAGPGGAAGAAGPRAASTLTAFQLSILRMLAEGLTDQSIARSLGVTRRTVTRRVAEIYETLGVESRFQAGMVAKVMGIV